MAGSLAALAALVACQRQRTRTAGSPLIVLSLFRGRPFSACLTVWLVFWIAPGGFFLVWTLYMQVGLGWSPLRADRTAVSFAAAATLALRRDPATRHSGRRPDQIRR